MKTDEYDLMFRVEDRHWWYNALRAVLFDCWRRHMPATSSVPLRVLDGGCGTGANLQFLTGQLKNAVSLAGIDYGWTPVKACRKRGLHCTAVASVLDLPFPDGSFDAAISCDVLCHAGVTDKTAAVREYARVLKPGGMLFLNLPSYQWLLSSHDIAVANDRRFSARDARDMLREAKLECVEIRFWNSLLLPAIVPIRLWRKLFPPRASDLDSNVTKSPLLETLMAFERSLARYVALPAGLSLMAVARKN